MEQTKRIESHRLNCTSSKYLCICVKIACESLYAGAIMFNEGSEACAFAVDGRSAVLAERYFTIYVLRFEGCPSTHTGHRLGL